MLPAMVRGILQGAGVVFTQSDAFTLVVGGGSEQVAGRVRSQIQVSHLQAASAGLPSSPF